MVKTVTNKLTPKQRNEWKKFHSDVKQMSGENEYKVPAKTWKKWNANQKKSFNYMYGLLMLNKDLFLHSSFDRKLMNDDHWHVTAYNVAFMTANVVLGSYIEGLKNVL
jgi:hypothetical protein